MLLGADQHTLLPEHFAEPDGSAEPDKNQQCSTHTVLVEVYEGDVERAAHHLGISRSQFYRRAKQHGIRPSSFRKRGFSQKDE